jgi:hypothetical protein
MSVIAIKYNIAGSDPLYMTITYPLSHTTENSIITIVQVELIPEH